MESRISEWLDAARRVDQMLTKVKAMALAGRTLPPDFVAELAMLEDAVQARLQDARNARPPQYRSH